MIIGLLSAGLSMFVSACAAYRLLPVPVQGPARRAALVLLVQMFPQFLAIVALYLMFATITDLWPPIGFNTRWGLLLLYLGGALGVNTWLMKGFFDTIPKDLDESAKVDGATHAQIFFGIILPLVAPILAVTGLLGFIGAVNEFMIASIFLTEDSAKTAAVGLYGLVSRGAEQQLRRVRRRHADPRDPDRRAVPVPAALHRGRPDRRRGQGLTTMALDPGSPSRTTTAPRCTCRRRRPHPGDDRAGVRPGPARRRRATGAWARTTAGRRAAFCGRATSTGTTAGRDLVALRRSRCATR